MNTNTNMNMNMNMNMNLNVDMQLRSYYLQAMGIIEWRLRDNSNHRDNSRKINVANLPKDTPADLLPYCYQLLANTQDKSMGLILADRTVNAEKAEAEITLLQAIVRALNLTTKEFTNNHPTAEDYLKNIFTSEPGNIVILLGKTVAQYKNQFTNSNVLMVVSYSLAELLQNPKLKAETWRALQPVLTAAKQK